MPLANCYRGIDARYASSIFVLVVRVLCEAGGFRELDLAQPKRLPGESEALAYGVGIEGPFFAHGGSLATRRCQFQHRIAPQVQFTRSLKNGTCRSTSRVIRVKASRSGVLSGVASRAWISF